MTNLFGNNAALTGEAVISDCGCYRYSLTRRWADGPGILFVMLNPSTADAADGDPTIRRCIGFANRDGFGALEVVNLFAYRATHPREILDVPDAVGVMNDNHIICAAQQHQRIVYAWGDGVRRVNQYRGEKRDVDVRTMLAMRAGAAPKCLGTTKHGYPRHPLVVRGNQPFVPYPPEAKE